MNNKLHPPDGPDILPQSATQKTYVKKLRSDIERTKRFVEQAEKAILQLKEEKADFDKQKEIMNEDSMRSMSSSKKAHLIALYEVYKQLPYLAIKNDLIGIATATTLTTKAVQEQARASKALKSENEAIQNEIPELESILSEYKQVNDYFQTDIDNHPTKMADQRSTIEKLHSALEIKIDQVTSANISAKKLEDALYSHVQRLVVKLHAMIDWESTNVADEETFRLNISRSATFIRSLVTSKVCKADTWVKVSSGTLEEHLAKLMVHHKILKLKSDDTLEVSL